MKRLVCFMILLLMVGVSAQAQGNPPGLSANDLKLLAEANSAALNSYAFQYQAQMTVDGLDTFALQADLSGSGALDRSAPALDITSQGSIKVGTTQTIPVNDELRWLNDTLYLNPGDGWQAKTGAGQYAADLVEQYAFLSADPGAMGKWDVSGIDGLADVIKALTAGDPTAFLSAQRLADDSVGSTQAAHFQTTLDLPALLQTDAFADAMLALANAEGTFAMTFNHDKFKQVNQANSMMFAGDKLTLDQYVGLDDHLLHRLVLTLDLPVDPTKGGFIDAPFKASATFDITLSDLNQAQSIAVPDGAKTVSDFSFPAAPALTPAGAGTTQYIFFDSVDADAKATQTFDAQASDKVTITVSGLELEFDSYIKLLSPDGKTLADNDDHAKPVFLLGDYESQIADFSIPATGTYTIQVSENDAAAGSFIVSVTIQR